MPVCATCGRRLDHAERSQRVCPSCTWHVALRGPHQTAVHTQLTESTVAMAARLHDLAMIVGERLNIASVEILEQVARGNARVYETEVTRLANRFVEHLDDNWDA